MSGPTDSATRSTDNTTASETTANAAASHASSPGAQEFLAQRRERLIEEQRTNNLSTGLMVAFGALVIAGIATFMIMSGSGDDLADVGDNEMPTSLAFDNLGTGQAQADGINDAGFDPHGGHDHASIDLRPHYSDDYSLTKLGGDVPLIIQQNMQLPDDSEVVHVIIQHEGVWEFEGYYPDGERFWKVIDLNRGLIYDGGNESNAEPFPPTFD